MAGVGAFVYHSIAGRVLGPSAYGEVGRLIAVFSIAGSVPNYILILVLARQAATLQARGRLGAITHMTRRTMVLTLGPCLVVVLVGIAIADPAAEFLKLPSPSPVMWLGAAVALTWLVAVPRGALQGLQNIQSLSINLSLEMVARTVSLGAFLMMGLAVTGSVIAVLVGATLALGIGMFSLRDLLKVEEEPVLMRTMGAFSLTAGAATLGIQLLFNEDVVLAGQYLSPAESGLYVALNKMGTIVFFLTLSVSQVMFPKVIEAMTRGSYPGRLLLFSAAIMSLLAGCALVPFSVQPALVQEALYPAYPLAKNFLLLAGLIGGALSWNNLLVQFLIAARERSFLYLLGVGCLLEGALIKLNHSDVRAILLDVLTTLVLLLAALSICCWLLLPKSRLQPKLLGE